MKGAGVRPGLWGAVRPARNGWPVELVPDTRLCNSTLLASLERRRKIDPRTEVERIQATETFSAVAPTVDDELAVDASPTVVSPVARRRRSWSNENFLPFACHGIESPGIVESAVAVSASHDQNLGVGGRKQSRRMSTSSGRATLGRSIGHDESPSQGDCEGSVAQLKHVSGGIRQEEVLTSVELVHVGLCFYVKIASGNIGRRHSRSSQARHRLQRYRLILRRPPRCVPVKVAELGLRSQ